MSEKEFREEIVRTAAGFSEEVEINRQLSYVAVGDFYIQGESANEMIDNIDKLVEKYSVDEKEAAIFIVENS